MEQDGEYGDQILMKALAKKFEFNLTIHWLDREDTLLIFNEPQEDFRMIHVSYHLNNHYNSVVSLDRKSGEKVERRKEHSKSFVCSEKEEAVYSN